MMKKATMLVTKLIDLKDSSPKINVFLLRYISIRWAMLKIFGNL